MKSLSSLPRVASMVSRAVGVEMCSVLPRRAATQSHRRISSRCFYGRRESTADAMQIRRLATGMADQALLKTEMVDGVAVVTMLGPDGDFAWGTRVFEHRFNPSLIAQVNKALDEAEKHEAQALMVIGEGRFFSNGMDLQFIRANLNRSTETQNAAEDLLARILSLGIPTVAAINGHATAAGAMFALAFDIRVMPSDSKGLFFVPGIDIGLVYSSGMTELMKVKLPQPLWNDVLCMAKRYQVAELFEHRVVNLTPSCTNDLHTEALRVASELKSKGKDEKTRATMSGIKANLYKDALAALRMEATDMGFATGTFDDTGRAAKN